MKTQTQNYFNMETTEKVRVLKPSTVGKTAVSLKRITSLSFNLRTGRIGFSVNLMAALREVPWAGKDPILVQFIQDTDSPKNWYLKVVEEDGFPVMLYGKKNPAKIQSHQVTNMAVVVEIAKSLNLQDPYLFTCYVSLELDKDIDSPFVGSFSIITASVVVKTKKLKQA